MPALPPPGVPDASAEPPPGPPPPGPPPLRSAVLRPAWADRRHLALLPADYVRDLLRGAPLPRAGAALRLPHLGAAVALEVVRRTPDRDDADVASATAVHVVPALPPSLRAAAAAASGPRGADADSDGGGDGGAEGATVAGFVRAALGGGALAPAVLVACAAGEGAGAPALAAAGAAGACGAAVVRFAAAGLGGALGAGGVRAAAAAAVAAAHAAAPAVLVVDGAHLLAPPALPLHAAALALALRALRAAPGPPAVLCAAPAPAALHPLVRAEADAELFVPRAAAAAAGPPRAPAAAAPAGWAAIARAVGGAGRAKRALLHALAWRRARARAFRRLGAAPPAGVLLYGPPGTGKTLLARAAAAAAGFELVAADAARLARGEVGASERALGGVFAAARRRAPCVVFVDEVDALFAGGRGGAAARVVAVFAREIDEAGDDVAVVAATNRPWEVAKDLLRAGRFDRCVHTPLPDEAARRDIAGVYARKMQAPPKVAAAVAEAAARSDGFSGADIAGGCRRAAMRAVERGEAVQVEDIRAGFAGMTRSVAPAMAQRIENWAPG